MVIVVDVVVGVVVEVVVGAVVACRRWRRSGGAVVAAAVVAAAVVRGGGVGGVWRPLSVSERNHNPNQVANIQSESLVARLRVILSRTSL